MTTLQRVVGREGDVVSVDEAGVVEVNGRAAVGPKRDLCEAEPLGLIKEYVKPKSGRVPAGSLYVLGDCKDVSIDSRVWGPLRSKDVVGTPVMRIWPLGRLGAIK